jgi:hypothetical protein
MILGFTVEVGAVEALTRRFSRYCPRIQRFNRVKKIIFFEALERRNL